MPRGYMDWTRSETCGKWLRHREVLGTPLTSAGVEGNLVPDAHLATLAIRHGLLPVLHRRRLWPFSRLALAESARRVSSRGAPTQLEMVLKVDGKPAPKRVSCRAASRLAVYLVKQVGGGFIGIC